MPPSGRLRKSSPRWRKLPVPTKRPKGAAPTMSNPFSPFIVGQKVVCVDDSDHPDWRVPGRTYVGGLDGLRCGEIYTCQAITEAWDGSGLILVLAEISRGRAISIY